MERYYSLSLLHEPESNKSITLRFETEKPLILEVIRILFIGKNGVSDSVKTALVGFKIDSKHSKDLEIDFPIENKEYTSVKLVVKDTTSKIQYKVTLSLQGEEPIYTKMIYGG